MRIYLFALLIVLATFPFEGLTIMGLPLARTMGFLLIFAFFFKIILSYSDGFSINKKHLIVLLALSSIILFSAIRSDNSEAAMVIVISLIANLLFFLIFCDLVKSPNSFSLSLILIAVSFFMSTLIAINVDLGVVQINNELNDDLRFSSFRQSGFLRNANRYGYFALLIFWCGVILQSLKLTSNKLSFSIILLGIIAVILSMSRAAIMGLSLGLVYYLLIWNGARTFMALCFGCITIFSASLFIPINQEEQSIANTLLKRFQPDVLLYSGSSSVRTSIWKDTIDRIDDNPLLGVPLGSLDGKIGMSGYKTHEPHNSFLYIFQYFGLFGLIVILLYFLWLLSIFLSADLNRKIRVLLITFSLSMLVPNLLHTTLTWKPTLLMFCYIVTIIKFSRNKSLLNSL